jgi:hypothetical protein
VAGREHQVPDHPWSSEQICSFWKFVCGVRIEQDHMSASHWASIGAMISPVIKFVFKYAPYVPRARTMRHKFGNRFAVFRDDEHRTRESDLIHQGEALGFKFGGFDVTGHERRDMKYDYGYDHGHITDAGARSRRRCLRLGPETVRSYSEGCCTKSRFNPAGIRSKVAFDDRLTH